MIRLAREPTAHLARDAIAKLLLQPVHGSAIEIRQAHELMLERAHTASATNAFSQQSCTHQK